MPKAKSTHKGNTNREENKTNLFVFYPEMQFTLFKGNTNREENKTNLFVFYPEMQFTLFKGNTNREENKTNRISIKTFFQMVKYARVYIGKIKRRKK